MVSRWVPTEAWRLGTDGYGRSDTREALRASSTSTPSTSPRPCSSSWPAQGRCDGELVAKAVAELDLEPEAPFAIDR